MHTTKVISAFDKNVSFEMCDLLPLFPLNTYQDETGLFIRLFKNEAGAETDPAPKYICGNLLYV